MSPTPSPSPVTIIGAGLGGLTLASVLHRRGIAVQVFDLDASPTARKQGGMLDIHEESGQFALRAAGLHEQFKEIVNSGGDAMHILDKTAAIRFEDLGDGERPEVERGDLRDLLLASLPDGTVRWGMQATGAHPLGDGRHEVRFTDGSIVATDVLVGADGAWSRIRPLLSAAKPGYSGVSFVEGHVPDADNLCPQSARIVGNGSMFALSEEKGFIAHRHADGSITVYTALSVPEGWLSSGDIDFTDPDQAKKTLLDIFDGWNEQLRGLIADSQTLIPRPIYALPVGHRWDRIPGVTLLGDAAHLMSPFAGEGANLAMRDGCDLAEAIAEHPGDVETALAEYEQTMFPRAEHSAAESAANLIDAFRADAPQGMLDMMARYQAQRP